jgi:hypothetical protein
MGIGIIKSADGGVSWVQILNHSFTFSQIIYNNRTGHLLATGNNKVYRSTDSGKSWGKPVTGLFFGSQIYALAENSNVSDSSEFLVPEYSYAGTSDGLYGLFKNNPNPAFQSPNFVVSAKAGIGAGKNTFFGSVTPIALNFKIYNRLSFALKYYSTAIATPNIEGIFMELGLGYLITRTDNLILQLNIYQHASNINRTDIDNGYYSRGGGGTFDGLGLNLEFNTLFKMYKSYYLSVSPNLVILPIYKCNRPNGVLANFSPGLGLGINVVL